MVDNSHLDAQYFIDSHVYNCPFCNRRNVAYHVMSKRWFDWSEKKTCWAYVVRCTSCTKRSLHLSFQHIELERVGIVDNEAVHRFNLPAESPAIDELMFYSVPTSFFVLDDRIPKILRELMTEAEASLKSNLLTGASACARKMIYELAALHGATGEDYEARIKALKVLRPEVDPSYFDTLVTIQEVTSTKVHEQGYDGWESKHLRIILAATSEILREIYVVPEERIRKRKAILELKDAVIGKKREESESAGK